MVTILLMSAKMTTPGLFKIRVYIYKFVQENNIHLHKALWAAECQ